MDDRLRCGRIHLVRAALVLTLAASLVIPQSRELQVLTFRLLLRLPGIRTVVQGQPAGCVLYIVPNVQFTEPFRQHCAANAAASPDDFLLARHCDHRVREFPAAQAWPGHPLLGWGAIEATWVVTQPPHDPAASQPAHTKAARIGEALRIVQHAQEVDPDNGALLAAQALLEFERGDSATGLRRLEMAAQCPRWDEYSAVAATRTRAQLQEHGLPRFDTVLATATSFSFSRVPGVIHLNRDHLDHVMAEAIRAGNDARLQDAARIWSQLTSSEDIERRCCALSLADATTELAPAAAGQLGRALPDLRQYEQRREAERTALRDYLPAHLPSELAQRLLDPDEPSTQARARLQQRCQTEHRILCDALWTSMPASLCLVLMAMIVGVLGIEIPFVIGRRRVPAEWARAWPFRLCLGAAGLAAAALIFLALDSVFQPVGLRSGPVDDPRPDHLGMALLIAGVLIAIRILLLNHRRTRLACFALLWLAYLTTVGVTAYWRYSVMEAFAALSH